MRNLVCAAFLLISLLACQSEVEKYGQLYQQKGDLANLEKALSFLQTETDTAVIKSILGEPIDMGFDYRYLTEQVGENKCVIGAVFHIDENGQIDDRWIGEICE